MMRRRPAWLGVALAVALGLSLAAVAQAQPAPPAIQLPPGTDTARFQVVIEGTVTATTNETIGGTNPACEAFLHGTYTERTTYRRGRGVVMEFVRLGTGRRAPVIVRRVGRRLDSTLGLQVVILRRAEGTAHRAPIPPAPPEACPPVEEDLSTGPDCGKPQRTPDKAALLYANRHLELKQIGLGSNLEIDCTRSEVTQIIPDVRFGWPTPVRLPKAPLTPATIFGKKRVIVLRVRSPQRTETQTAQLPAGLVARRVHNGDNEATIRLIRVG
jgi:hypothetical protein